MHIIFVLKINKQQMIMEELPSKHHMKFEDFL